MSFKANVTINLKGEKQKLNQKNHKQVKMVQTQDQGKKQEHDGHEHSNKAEHLLRHLQRWTKLRTK